jgi:hypothetical protein
MRGSVVKKGGKWYFVKIELDPDPLTGKRRQKWHSGFKTKRRGRAGAHRPAVEVRPRRVRRADAADARRLPVEWLKRSNTRCARRRSTRTKRNMHNHVIAHIGSTTLSRGRRRHAERALRDSCSHRADVCRRRTGRGYSPEIVDRAIELRALGSR